jgi:hypothetical protein
MEERKFKVLPLRPRCHPPVENEGRLSAVGRNCCEIAISPVSRGVDSSFLRFGQTPGASKAPEYVRKALKSSAKAVG